MTTRVTVDAHAGWPVLVVLKYGEAQYAKSYVTERVEPYTQKDFYIHSGLAIVDIIECTESWTQRPDPQVAEDDPNAHIS